MEASSAASSAAEKGAARAQAVVGDIRCMRASRPRAPPPLEAADAPRGDRVGDGLALGGAGTPRPPHPPAPPSRGTPVASSASAAPSASASATRSSSSVAPRREHASRSSALGIAPGPTS